MKDIAIIKQKKLSIKKKDKTETKNTKKEKLKKEVKVSYKGRTDEVFFLKINDTINNFESDSNYRPIKKEVSDRVRNAVSYAENVKKPTIPQFQTYFVNGKEFKSEIKNKIFNEITFTFDNISDGSKGKILLFVRKGKWIQSSHYCADCKNLSKPIWRYRISNYGEIHLCNLCKILAFERSFGHADAMPLKIDHAHAHNGKW